MLVAKQDDLLVLFVTWFENYVNYAGSKTLTDVCIDNELFENYVNYAGSKTGATFVRVNSPFENYVNYAGSKTMDAY